MRAVRIALVAVAGVAVVAAGAAAIALASFDPNSFKPDMIAAVKRATGRDLTLNGKIGIKVSLTPTIRVADASFSNPPGFSRPQMATLQGMEVQFALLPLLSKQLQIDRLLLIHPDILLETDAAGRANWQMTPQVSPTAPPGSQAPAQPGKSKTVVSVDTIRIQDGKLAYRDDQTAKIATIDLPKLDASAESPDSPLHLDMDGRYNGTVFNLIADTGPVTRLQDPAVTSPWPVKLALTIANAKLAAEGVLTEPLQGKGYTLGVNGTIPDLSLLTPLLQGIHLPPLRDVTFAAQVADKGGKLPDVSSLSLHAGASDLSAQVPGLTLTKLDVDAPAADQPLKASATGQRDGTPLSLEATLGAPTLFVSDGKPAPFPIDITLLAVGARLSAKGSITDAWAMTGANISLSAQVPNLAALSPLVRRPLPALKQVAFQATAADPVGGLRSGVVMRALSLTSSDGDLAGDVSVNLQPRTVLTANLTSKRLDLNVLNDMPVAEAPAPSQDVKPQPTGKPSNRLFSDNPIPFERLRTLDADMHLAVDLLRAGGVDTRALILHANLQNGKLTVDRFVADLPGGHLSGTFAVDAALASPRVHLVLHAPGLALASILAAARQPPFASGNLEIDANLSGIGETPHAIAGSLNGMLSLALAGGTIDNRILGSVLGKVIDSVNALDLVGKGGASEVRCFALRMETSHGTGTIQPLTLSSSLLTITGGGTVELGSETLDMIVRPQVRMGGTSLLVPMKLTGPIRSPAVAVDRLGAAESNAGTVAGAVIGGTTSLGVLGGLFATDKLLGGKGGDICSPALAAARGQPIPASTGPEQSPSAKTIGPKLSDPGAMLKSLLQ